MKNKILLLFSLLCIVFTNKLTAQVNQQDSLALVDLYQSANGKQWSASNNWVTEKPVSTWYGVSVSGNRVTGLLLDFNNLKGTLPSSIGNLGALTSLSVAFNKLFGSIPATIGNLTSLKNLEMENNRLTGSIPASFTGLLALRLVSVNNNQLSGSFPQDVERLTNLEYFNVSFNRISGIIPNGFGSIASLSELYLNNNGFTGNIPRSLGNLTGMLVLDLGYNKLRGTIPPSLSNLKELFVLSLNNNELTGSVPLLIASSDINLNNNHLSQSTNIPVTGSRDYTRVDLRYNDFNFNGLEYAAAKLFNAEYRFQAKLPVHAVNNGLAVTAGGTLQNNTYAWFREGATGATIIKADSTFTPAQSGRYYAVVRNAIATRLTLTTDTVSFTVPAASSASTIAIAVSPNPATHALTVSGLDANTDYRVMITDVSGNVWLNTVARKQSLVKLDVTSLKAGNYLLNISDRNGVNTLPFVKN